MVLAVTGKGRSLTDGEQHIVLGVQRQFELLRTPPEGLGGFCGSEPFKRYGLLSPDCGQFGGIADFVFVKGSAPSFVRVRHT
jgi:hypothetical protein